MKLQSKVQVMDELNKIDDLIARYSQFDMVRVGELVESKKKLESVLLNIMNVENDLYLSKIKAAA